MEDHRQQLLREMSREELNSLIALLAAYTLRRSRWLGLNPATGGALPGGETVESIVSMAFEKLLSGKRIWDPGTYPVLEDFLKSVIRSDLEHLARSNRRLVPLSDDGNGDHPAATPRQLLLNQEREKRDKAALEEVIRQCENDPVAAEMINLMRDGYEPREIADKMGLLIKVVYSTARRIRRACASVGEQLREPNPKVRGATKI